MLMLISPAKNLNDKPSSCPLQLTEIEFSAQAQQLVEILKAFSPQQLSSLMSISDKLGVLNYDRYQAWSFPFDDSAAAALLTFNGDVYTGLDAESLSLEQLQFTQTHLRILSGLYGLLSPLDAMLPYRLEMGTKLGNPKGANLYAFWGRQIAEALQAQLQTLDSNCLVNLASNEYFKAVDRNVLSARIINPQFKDQKNGQYKIISFYAKKARGLMCRYAIDHQIDRVEDLRGFDYAGYEWNKSLSEGDTWVFTRNEMAAK